MFEDYRILYLEDEPIIALDTQDMLSSLAFKEVVVANRLIDAQNAADQASFDVAILDINVDRGQTSTTLGQQLATGGTHVIFASGNGGDRKQLVAEGFRFVDKPFTLPRLQRELTEALQA